MSFTSVAVVEQEEFKITPRCLFILSNSSCWLAQKTWFLSDVWHKPDLTRSPSVCPSVPEQCQDRGLWCWAAPPEQGRAPCWRGWWRNTRASLDSACHVCLCASWRLALSCKTSCLRRKWDGSYGVWAWRSNSGPANRFCAIDQRIYQHVKLAWPARQYRLTASGLTLQFKCIAILYMKA